MTELETIKRAKMYIEKMANKINPLTDEAVSENDVINNDRISRCLFFVTNVLDQVIKKGGTTQKNTRPPFFITDEQLKNLQVNDMPLYVSGIADKINRVSADNDMQKMQAAWINQWLISIGMLEIVDNVKRTTEQGIKLGIKTELRRSEKYGDYYVNYFSPEAQSFVFNNIRTISDFHYSNKQ